MSFRIENLVGEVKSTTVQEVKEVAASEITIRNNGDRITIVGEIKRIITESGVSQVAAFKVEAPGKPAEIITSLESPALVDASGRDRELPQGARVTPVTSAKAGNGPDDEENDDDPDYEDDDEDEDDDDSEEESDTLVYV